ncbi:hypothetical protein A2625_04920 [candidate division WOR-1 bacterium RIFCSPHIGHO2_01_FULL_53_15]|uniref:HepT-like domain-containing protein n=1 Tax=candidate division WOR-1 bacterium RIFCSPHIGHO2_01_FULL_53_15 TaxID=1802564 RepID=A0A1F4Q2J2_UNCSA|nr:MAG: hypothetical protein A2625_04920 [candidate division WOR-1 bacterium RIFCSPHIGHO2_01_FULL_53_15]OGC13221.1 MAG: hypothetical protein A3D23_01175 [candidate division WOR-1 bacterium RIFCSPHIGHO2_02_FULL_53_26]
MGKFDGLIIDIDLERKNLFRLVDELKQFVSSLGGRTDSMEVRVAGGILHDFYTGLEKIFERIALAVDGGLPEGEGWHIQLLRRMTIPFAERRPAVLTADLGETLSEFLSFRHLFRNIYGFELKKERLQNLSAKLPSVFGDIDSQLKQFTNFLSKF